MFQFTRPRGARLRILDKPISDIGFQFTRPRGARLPRVRSALCRRCFNSRAHEGRDGTGDHRGKDIRCFNSRAHEGRDHGQCIGRLEINRFNSRAHEGRDRTVQETAFSCSSFNSRAHEGRDTPPIALLPIGVVSIHAPTRGATAGGNIYHLAPWFQFTRPRGARRGFRTASGLTLPFQFTRPRGARPAKRRHEQEHHSFNSRAHEGRDDTVIPVFLLEAVSIHAPTRGATIRPYSLFPTVPGFNSRAHEGRDMCPS